MRRRITFALPGDPAALTGGYIYDAQIVAGLRERGWMVDLVLLGDGFPFPSAETAREAGRLLNAAATHGPVIVDGLALGVLPKAAVEVAAKSPLIALVHHPLALENGVSAQAAASLAESERRSLANAAIVVTTSATTAAIVERDYGVAREKLLFAKPGVRSPGGGRVAAFEAPHLLSVGAISPRKGYPYLVDALAALRDLDWRLTIVGDASRNPEASAGLMAQIERLELGTRIELRDAVTDDQLDALYRQADVFVLASLYEGYGMAYAEAIAHGLPVIGTTGGAIREAVPAEAALLVEPGDAASLSAALRLVLTDRARLKAMSAAACAAAPLMPSWEQAVDVFERALVRLQGETQ